MPNPIHYDFQKQPPEVFCKKGVLRNFAKFTEKHGIPEFLDSGLKSWTLAASLWTLDWTLDSGRWTLDAGL